MQVLNIFHVLIAIAMVALVLVQRGAGATAGAAFGSGASGTVFGARGAGNFLTRSTWILGTLFCAISLTMAVMVSRTAATPQTDLGVVASTPAASQPAEDSADSVAPPPSAEGAQTDLPPIELPVETGSPGAAEDLPAFDGSSDVSEGAMTEESVAGAAADDS